MAAQAVGIVGIVAIGGELLRLTRQAIDPGRPGANPQGAGGIFVEPVLINDVTA